MLTWHSHHAAHDRWHEYDLPPEATFAQLKIPVLRHWNILPEIPSSRPLEHGSSKAASPAAVSHPPATPESIVSSVQELSSAPSRPQTRRGTLKGPTLSSPPFSTSESLEELRTTLPGTQDVRKRSSWTPAVGSATTGYASMEKDLLHECARIMANYSFKPRVLRLLPARGSCPVEALRRVRLACGELRWKPPRLKILLRT